MLGGVCSKWRGLSGRGGSCLSRERLGLPRGDNLTGEPVVGDLQVVNIIIGRIMGLMYECMMQTLTGKDQPDRGCGIQMTASELSDQQAKV